MPPRPETGMAAAGPAGIKRCGSGSRRRTGRRIGPRPPVMPAVRDAPLSCALSHTSRYFNNISKSGAIPKPRENNHVARSIRTMPVPACNKDGNACADIDHPVSFPAGGIERRRATHAHDAYEWLGAMPIRIAKHCRGDATDPRAMAWLKMIGIVWLVSASRGSKGFRRGIPPGRHHRRYAPRWRDRDVKPGPRSSRGMRDRAPRIASRVHARACRRRASQTA